MAVHSVYHAKVVALSPAAKTHLAALGQGLGLLAPTPTQQVLTELKGAGLVRETFGSSAGLTQDGLGAISTLGEL